MLEEEVLKIEIKWHEENRGMTDSEDYEKGFIAGLRQALILIAAQHRVQADGAGTNGVFFNPTIGIETPDPFEDDNTPRR